MSREFSEKEIKELNENGLVVNADEADAVAFADGRWGTTCLTLTPEILEQLKQGKVWASSDGEYTTLIRFGKDGHRASNRFGIGG